MPSIRARIWNGRPLPCEHDTLPIARIGTVQPHGVMMVVVPETGCVEHVSANVEEILGVPARAVLGQQPTMAFQDPESVRRLQDILRPGRRFFENPTPLQARGRAFEAICHLRDGRLFIEIEPYVTAEHDYQTMVSAAVDAISRQTTVQGLYAAAARMMHFVTRYDRVKLYKFLSHGHGVVVAEQHAPDSKLPGSFLGYHFSASDVPEAAKEILLTGKTRQKPTQRGSVPLLMRGPDGEPTESGPRIDMTDCWLRGIHPCDNGYNNNLGVGSNIIFPVCLDDSLWGLFVVHNKDEKFLNYDSRAVIEQLTMMFASRLVELEAGEARIEERQRLAQQMVATVEAAQAMLSSTPNLRGDHGNSIRLHAMHAMSRHVAALAPTYVSATGLDRAVAGNPEDRFSFDLLRLADADGAAVLRAGPGGHVHLIGATPDALAVRGLAALFGSRLPAFEEGEGRVFATDALGDFAPLTPDLIAVASGLLAAPIGNRGDMILWFRKERVIDAIWAGRPPSVAELNSEKMFRPRDDFAAHRAPLAGASRPWLESEVLLAAQFAVAVSQAWQGTRRDGAEPMPPPEAAPVVYADPALEPDGMGARSGRAFTMLPGAAAAGPWAAAS
ncbi:GAF domain-containing protein [Paracraurococcus ruber]|nr:GAF domain-containing protein [Paracraurococcus ruber]